MPASKAWRYSNLALADLIAAAQYLDEESESSGPGDRLIEASAEACDQIGQFPHSGRQRDDLEPGLRSMPLTDFPYLVLYRIGEREIEIARVLHERQDLKKAFKKKH